MEGVENHMKELKSQLNPTIRPESVTKSDHGDVDDADDKMGTGKEEKSSKVRWVIKFNHKLCQLLLVQGKQKGRTARKGQKRQYRRTKTEKMSPFSNVDTIISGISRRILKGRSYNCGLCLASFCDVVELEHHLKFGHTKLVQEEMRKVERLDAGDSKRSICCYCSKKFYDKNNLVRHALEVHTLFRSHICQLCPDRKGFHKPEFGHDHVKRYHEYEMNRSLVNNEQFLRDTIKYVPRPYDMTLAITPVPKHLYFIQWAFYVKKFELWLFLKLPLHEVTFYEAIKKIVVEYREIRHVFHLSLWLQAMAPGNWFFSPPWVITFDGSKVAWTHLITQRYGYYFS